jgi:hypothetical protein
MFSCSKGYGTSYVQKNLTVYYTNNNDLNLVQKLADYWFSNGLIGTKAQTIRLITEGKNNRQLQLIAVKNLDVKSLKFDDISKLQTLENELNQTIFKGNEVDVVLCNSRFIVTNNLNY